MINITKIYEPLKTTRQERGLKIASYDGHILDMNNCKGGKIKYGYYSRNHK